MATTRTRPVPGRHRWASLLAGVAASAGLHGCMAMSPEQDPVYLKQVEIDNRLVRVERLVDNQGLLNLQNQLDQLLKDNQSLRNEVEKLRHDVDAASERQRQQYLDLDQRLQGRAAPVATGATAGAGAATGAAAGAEVAAESAAATGADRTAYQAAFDLLKQGKYDESAAAFRDFLRKYPGSGLADNAQYWLGESYYVSQKYKEALAEFDTVLSRYPDSRKTPDALLKGGFCHYELKQWADARQALSSVVQKFPGTTAAKLASQRLEQMARDGH